MPTIQVLRLTQSGACAACGNYPGILPHICRRPTDPRLRVGRMRKASLDARNSAAARQKVRRDNDLVRGR